jgi:anti-anti-sigma factor
MEIRVVDRGCVVALSGRLGAASVADARDALHHALDDGDGDLVVDLADVELVDATGLGLLLGTHRRADRAGRRLVLRGVPDRIERLLVATRLSRVLCTDDACINPAADEPDVAIAT